MTTIYIVKQYADANCNSSVILKAFFDEEKAKRWMEDKRAYYKSHYKVTSYYDYENNTVVDYTDLLDISPLEVEE